jgi:hypothetical protein
MTMKFQDLKQFTNDDAEAAIGRNDPGELPFVPVTIALASSDHAFAQEVCLRLAVHANSRVRGNAIMSLGHLARRFRLLNEPAVRPIIESALVDSDESVRMLAKSAADEIHQFLGWTIAGHVYG